MSIELLKLIENNQTNDNNQTCQQTKDQPIVAN